MIATCEKSLRSQLMMKTLVDNCNYYFSLIILFAIEIKSPFGSCWLLVVGFLASTTLCLNGEKYNYSAKGNDFSNLTHLFSYQPNNLSRAVCKIY